MQRQNYNVGAVKSLLGFFFSGEVCGVFDHNVGTQILVASGAANFAKSARKL